MYPNNILRDTYLGELLKFLIEWQKSETNPLCLAVIVLLNALSSRAEMS